MRPAFGIVWVWAKCEAAPLNPVNRAGCILLRQGKTPRLLQVAAAKRQAWQVTQTWKAAPDLRIAPPRESIPSCKRGAVEVHMLPASGLTVPDAGFLEGLRVRSVGADALIEADIADDGHVAQQADARRRHGRVVAALGPAQIEVEAVEVQALDELSTCLR